MTRTLQPRISSIEFLVALIAHNWEGGGCDGPERAGSAVGISYLCEIAGRRLLVDFHSRHRRESNTGKTISC